jgi:hypothetical protein
MDPVRRYMQTRGMLASQVGDKASLPTSARVAGVLEVTKSIYADHGIKGFFRGALPAAAKSAISATVVFSLYNVCVNAFERAA